MGQTNLSLKEQYKQTSGSAKSLSLVMKIKTKAKQTINSYNSMTD